jgi:hypothetical protein
LIDIITIRVQEIEAVALPTPTRLPVEVRGITKQIGTRVLGVIRRVDGSGKKPLASAATQVEA